MAFKDKPCPFFSILSSHLEPCVGPRGDWPRNLPTASVWNEAAFEGTPSNADWWKDAATPPHSRVAAAMCMAHHMFKTHRERVVQCPPSECHYVASAENAVKFLATQAIAVIGIDVVTGAPLTCTDIWAMMNQSTLPANSADRRKWTLKIPPCSDTLPWKHDPSFAVHTYRLFARQVTTFKAATKQARAWKRHCREDASSVPFVIEHTPISDILSFITDARNRVAELRWSELDRHTGIHQTRRDALVVVCEVLLCALFTPRHLRASLEDVGEGIDALLLELQPQLSRAVGAMLLQNAIREPERVIAELVANRPAAFRQAMDLAIARAVLFIAKATGGDRVLEELAPGQYLRYVVPQNQEWATGAAPELVYDKRPIDPSAISRMSAIATTTSAFDFLFANDAGIVCNNAVLSELVTMRSRSTICPSNEWVEATASFIRAGTVVGAMHSAHSPAISAKGIDRLGAVLVFSSEDDIGAPRELAMLRCHITLSPMDASYRSHTDLFSRRIRIDGKRPTIADAVESCFAHFFPPSKERGRCFHPGCVNPFHAGAVSGDALAKLVASPDEWPPAFVSFLNQPKPT